MKVLWKLCLVIQIAWASTSWAQANKPTAAAAATCQAGSGPETYLAATSDDLNNYLACTQPGDTILLAAGRTYAGPFELPAKSGSKYITIMTNAAVAPEGRKAQGALPGAGVRVSPADAGVMPRITTSSSDRSPSNSALTTAPAASYYRFVGVEITTDYYVYNLILLGLGSEKNPHDLPHHITFDRSYIHGSPTRGTRRGIAANGGRGLASGARIDLSTGSIEDLVFTNSYFADFKDSDADSQAICVWNGYGPFKIVNNYIEAAGENVMFGGEDPSISRLVPSNITIRENHFYKPLVWMGQKWWVKNLFELKNASDVWIENNVFENNWVQQQNGMGILLTPRNQDGKSPWAVVQHVTFRSNILNNSPGGFTILGYDDIHPSQQLNDIIIQNNLLLNIGNQRIGLTNGRTYNTCGTNRTQCGRMMQIGNGAKNVTFDHNTAFNTSAVTYSWKKPNQGFTMTNNVVRNGSCRPANNCGMSGDDRDPGKSAIALYFRGSTVADNVIYDSRGEPHFQSDYTQQTYTSKGIPMGIDRNVWPVYLRVVQVTSEPE